MTRSRYLLIVVVGGLTLTAVLAENQGVIPGCGSGGIISPWRTVANHPAAVQSLAVASDGVYVYSAGGFNGSAPIIGAYRYDPAVNNWGVLPSLPTAVDAARAVYAANTNSIYVFGGENGTYLNTTQIYHIATNNWTSGAPMPAARALPNVAYYPRNGKIYVIGGFAPGFVEQSQTWEYDPVANSWNTSRASIPVPMGGSAANTVGQFIYLAGSFGGGAGSTTHYRYSVASNSWTPMAAVPVNIYAPASAAFGRNIYLIGGGNPGIAGDIKNRRPYLASAATPDTAYDSTYVYDTETNIWSTGPDTNSAHAFSAGAAIGSRLIAVAGYTGSSETNVAEMTNVSTAGCTAAALNEGFESGTLNTFASSVQQCVPGGCGWSAVTTASHAGARSAFSPDVANLADQRLLSISAIPIPSTGVGGAVLTFWHRYTFEGSGANYYDGGVLETSTDGGASWQDAGANITSGGYNGTIPTGFNNPLAGRMAWGQASPGYPAFFQTTVNLMPYAGQSILIRFRQGDDSSQASTGWWIDDVKISFAMSNCPTAASRKTHGGSGTFEVNLPLSDVPGIECRSGGATNDYTVVANFASPVTVTGGPQAQVTSGAGVIGSAGAGNGGMVSVAANVVTIPLTNVSNAQTIEVTLYCVNDGATTNDVVIPLSRLLSDTNANGTVNASDVSQSKARIGQPLGSSNFRSDVNANGTVNASDVSQIKASVGSGLP